MIEYDLLLTLQLCEQMVQEMGILPLDIATVCVDALDQLKDIVADGDYNKYKEWYGNNASRILSEGSK
jgi:hypothetical protein